MLLSAVSVLVVAQSSSEIPEGLMNNPVYKLLHVSGKISCACRRPTSYKIYSFSGQGIYVAFNTHPSRNSQSVNVLDCF